MLDIGAEVEMGNRPATVQNPPAPVMAWPKAVDIEELVQWALAQTGNLPWRNPSADDLAMDHGWDCVPKATRALYQPSGGLALKRAIDPDAALVIELIKMLPAATAAQVIACAREKIRPNSLIGIEPRRVPKGVYAKKRGKKKHRRSTIMVWTPCEPAAICAARAAYTRWHGALLTLDSQVRGALKDWRITVFGIPAEPWNKP